MYSHVIFFLANSSLGMAVFETNNQQFEQSDLKLFQQNYATVTQSALVRGITPLTSTCNTTACGEGSLDIQYVMGLANKAKATYWHTLGNGTGLTSDPFIEFLTEVAATPNPPTALSISWGSLEAAYSANSLDAFNTLAQQLGLAGITIFVSSGDNGVSYDYSNTCLCAYSSSSSILNSGVWTGSAWTGTGYFPSFPASSPYVVAVGATEGPEKGTAEVTCQVSVFSFPLS
jgi:subtilase family serine protease